MRRWTQALAATLLGTIPVSVAFVGSASFSEGIPVRVPQDARLLDLHGKVLQQPDDSRTRGASVDHGRHGSRPGNGGTGHVASNDSRHRGDRRDRHNWGTGSSDRDESFSADSGRSRSHGSDHGATGRTGASDRTSRHRSGAGGGASVTGAPQARADYGAHHRRGDTSFGGPPKAAARPLADPPPPTASPTVDDSGGDGSGTGSGGGSGSGGSSGAGSSGSGSSGGASGQ